MENKYKVCYGISEAGILSTDIGGVTRQFPEIDMEQLFSNFGLKQLILIMDNGGTIIIEKDV